MVTAPPERCWITFNREGEPMFAHVDESEALEAVHNGGMVEAVEYVRARPGEHKPDGG